MFALLSFLVLLLLLRGVWVLLRLVRAVPRRNDDFKID